MSKLRPHAHHAPRSRPVRPPARSTQLPGRAALLAAESGPPLPQPGGAFRVALVYPNSYRVGMASLGFQIAYQTIWATPGARAERFFLDTMAEGSIETGTSLREFDLICFSAAYEMDGPNVLAVLEQAGLPLLAAQRTAQGRWPLVLMGGVLTSVNRLPLYPFVDVFAHGEAELILPAAIACARPTAGLELARAQVLEDLMQTPGVEVTAGALAAAGLPLSPEQAALAEMMPQLETEDPAAIAAQKPWPQPPAPARSIMLALESGAFTSSIVTPHSEFSGMALVDLARGCPHHCTFCWIGHHSPAYRVRPMRQILEGIERLEPYTDRFGLVASAVGAHPQIDELVHELVDWRRLRISYSSLRVEEVSDTMLRALMQGGGKSVTIAPEAGNLRVRRLLGKRLSDERIFDVCEQIFGLGAENLKMYFMIGVPTETDEEALEVAVFTEKIRQIQLRWARERGRMGTLGINLGIYVPKPELPLSRLPAVPLAEVKKRLKKVVHALDRIPNTQVNVSSPDLARAQGILSMSGPEAAAYLLELHKNGGQWRHANRTWDERG